MLLKLAFMARKNYRRNSMVKTFDFPDFYHYRCIIRKVVQNMFSLNEGYYYVDSLLSNK